MSSRQRPAGRPPICPPATHFRPHPLHADAARSPRHACAQAPGQYIRAAWVGSSNTATNSISGTSMAAPHVSGVAAQLLAEDPTLSVARVKEIILAAAEVDSLVLSADAVLLQTPNRFLIGGAGIRPILHRPSPPPSPPMPPPSPPLPPPSPTPQSPPMSPPSPPLPPLSPPLPPSPPTPSMAVTGLGCALVPLAAGQCVRSTGYPVGYSENEACTITNPPEVPISVTSFQSEAHWVSPEGVDRCVFDYLTVNGVRYCGTVSPEGVVPDGTPIEWRTDDSVSKEGWELCFPPRSPSPRPPSPPPPPPSPPPPSPSPPPPSPSPPPPSPPP